MYNDKKNGKIGIIITIIILVFLVIITNLDNAILSKIANPFTKITMSVQSGIVYAKNKLSKNNEYFTTLDNLKEQNEQLRAENEQKLKIKHLKNTQNYQKNIQSFQQYQHMLFKKIFLIIVRQL